MGIFSALNAAFENTSSSKTYFSILSSRMNRPQNTLTSSDSDADEDLYSFLENYSFLQQILTRIASTINDVFNKSSMHVTLDGKYKKQEDDVNNFLNKIQLLDIIKIDLNTMLFRGNYGYKFDFKNNLVKRLLNAEKVLTEDTYCTDRRLIIDNWVDRDEGPKYALVPYQYKPKKFKMITELDAYLDTLDPHENKQQATEEYLKKHPNADKIIKHTIYKGTGVLDHILYLLLILYMKELLSDLLGLKDTMRPDILTARVADDKTDEDKISQAMNDIESLVNEGTSASTDGASFTSLISIANLLSSIQSYLVNGVKVVPEMNNFTSISKLDLPNLIGKRQALNQEIEELRRRILDAMGMDDKVSDNKWDAIQRNSRYLTIIEDLVDSISVFIRNIVFEYLSKNYPDKNIKLTEIVLDLDTTNIIFNQYAVTRSRVLLDKVDSITRTMRAADDLKSSDLFDPDGIRQYIKKLIADIDPTAADMITDKPVQKEPEVTEEPVADESTEEVTDEATTEEEVPTEEVPPEEEVETPTEEVQETQVDETPEEK